MRRRAGLTLVAVLAACSWSCHSAKLFAPPPPLRAASAALYAVDVQFASPLDRGSAEDAAHYVLRPAGGGASPSIGSATVIDSLEGRLVRLVLPDWFGDSTVDRADWILDTTGLLDAWGRPLPDASTQFRTGLAYGDGMGALFDDHCTSCHGPANAAGNYRTDSRAGLLGNGLDATPNLVPGDPNCLLVRVCRQGRSMATAGRLEALDSQRVLNWVQVYSARP